MTCPNCKLDLPKFPEPKSCIHGERFCDKCAWNRGMPIEFILEGKMRCVCPSPTQLTPPEGKKI